MTAMDVFESYKSRGARIARLEEKIKRREAVMTSGTSRLSGDGGRSSGDASMRLIDYVSNIEELRGALDKAISEREREKACCLYLAEALPGLQADVMARIYLGGMTVREAAGDLGYSASYIKRVKGEAEKMCREITILYWDGVHVPAISTGRS